MDAIVDWVAWVLAGILAWFASLPGFTKSSFQWLHDNKDGLGGLQSLVTVLATLVGAWWAIRRFGWTREGYAQANIEATVVCTRLDAALTLVSVSVAIENKGKRQVQVRSGWVELQQVLPLGPGIAAGAPLSAPGRRRVEWTVLATYRFRDGKSESGPEKTQAHIDPGERDTLTFEFFIPGAVKVIKAWGHLRDPQTNLGYPFEVLVDVDRPAAAAVPPVLPASAPTPSISGATTASSAPSPGAPPAPGASPPGGAASTT